MLSIEEIKLLIEKLEKVKSADLQKLIDSNLKILKDLETAVDANNTEQIHKFNKPLNWFRKDLEFKRDKPIVDPLLYRAIKLKINQFAKSNMYNSLEIGPGTGMFSKDFRAWRLNYFLDVLPELEQKIRRRFPPMHQHYLKFYFVDNTNYMGTVEAYERHLTKHSQTYTEAIKRPGSNIELITDPRYKIPDGSCNLMFSWDTFVFFTRAHIKRYLESIKKIIIPGGYCFIHYTDCHFDYDLHEAKRSYWNYNTKTEMEKIIKNAGYQVIEMAQFRPGANYAIFKNPGNQNPAVYKISEITID